MYIAEPRRIDRSAMIDDREIRLSRRRSESMFQEEGRDANDNAWADTSERTERIARMFQLHFPKVKPHPKRGEWQPDEPETATSGNRSKAASKSKKRKARKLVPA